MGYIPFNYEEINYAAGTHLPNTIKAYNNQTFAFWQRALFQRACSTLIITMPDEWKKNKDLLYWCLFRIGFACCGKDNDFGVGKWFNPCTLSGFDFYYRPTKAIVSNPYIKNRTGMQSSMDLIIGKDVELIKLTPDYRGIWDIISYYAEKLAACDVAINSAIINSKFAYMIGGKNKAANEVMKKMFDKINQGEPAVFFDAKLANDGMDKEEPWQFLDRKVKDSYIVTDLLRDFQTILNNFDTEVGIPTIPYEKKERMVTSEAESRQIDATSRSVIWFDTLKQTFDIANSFMEFGSDGLKVELRYDLIKEGGAQDGQSEINAVRNG